MSRIQVEKFLGYTDLPLYGRDPGWCAALTNMRVMPGGYVEARGGMDKIKPSGGTAADVASAGVATGAHEHTLPNVGWVVLATSGGTSFGTNQALKAFYYLWPATAAQHDSIYVGSDSRFSRVVLYNNGVNGATAPTYAYEYSTSAWTTSTGSALTTTATPSFNPGAATFGEQLLEFAVPSDWTAQVINGVLQYWVRIRVTNAPTAWGTRPAQAIQRVYADWQGDRQVYVSVADGSAGTANAAVKRYGQTGTTVSWTSVDSSLFSGNNARTRFASYRGVLYYVNGKEQRRWNQDTAAAIGFTKPATTGNGLTSTDSGAGVLNGTFSWAVTYGYGPAGEWGESNEQILQSTESPPAAPTAGSYFTVANRQVTLTFNLTSIPSSGIADYIYVYRTADLASVPASVRASVPFYRIATVKRASADATFPTTYVDGATGTSTAIPFPAFALNIATNTPPTRCRFIGIHKNRMFLGSNNQYPGRVWWSEPFQAEAFITDENFADFTRQTGGILTGLIEFNDQIVVFTEDQMFGIANVDTDTPDIYVIHPSVGCIAPDSVASGAGYLMWLGRNGVYLWDGQQLPRRVSDDTSATFGKMTLESYGGSRAIIHDRMYTVQLVDNNDTLKAAGSPLRYDLVTGSWSFGLFGDSTISKLGPFVGVHAPLGHADAGVRHSLWGPVDKSTAAWPVYLGEYTTADNGSTFSLRVDVHLGPKGYAAFSIDRLAAYYDDGGLSASPTLATPNNAFQWATPSLATGAVDLGTQYRLLEVNAAEKSQGSGGIIARWTGTQATGGTLNGSRLHAIYMDGDLLEPIRR